MIKLQDYGWRIEWMKCPKCGMYVASKPNKENGYSQFRCTNLVCDFEDNLTEETKLSLEKMKKHYRIINCKQCGKRRAVSLDCEKSLCWQCNYWTYIDVEKIEPKEVHRHYAASSDYR